MTANFRSTCLTFAVILASLGWIEGAYASPTAVSNSAIHNAPIAEPKDYAQSGWKIVTFVKGHLFQDSEENAVLVLQGTDARKIVANKVMGESRLDLNRRKLAILRRDRQGWRLIDVVISDLLPSAGSVETPCLADPFEEGGVAIDGRVLAITLQYFLSCGSYGDTTDVWKFRMEGRRLRLIGLEKTQFSRSSHDETVFSTNFLNRRQIVTSSTENAEGEIRPTDRRVHRISAAKYWLDSMSPKQCELDRKAKPAWC